MITDEATQRPIVLKMRRNSRLSRTLKDGRRYTIVLTRDDGLDDAAPIDIVGPVAGEHIHGYEILAVSEL